MVEMTAEAFGDNYTNLENTVSEKPGYVSNFLSNAWSKLKEKVNPINIVKDYVSDSLHVAKDFASGNLQLHGDSDFVKKINSKQGWYGKFEELLFSDVSDICAAAPEIFSHEKNYAISKEFSNSLRTTAVAASSGLLGLASYKGTVAAVDSSIHGISKAVSGSELDDSYKHMIDAVASSAASGVAFGSTAALFGISGMAKYGADILSGANAKYAEIEKELKNKIIQDSKNKDKYFEIAKNEKEKARKEAQKNIWGKVSNALGIGTGAVSGSLLFNQAKGVIDTNAESIAYVADKIKTGTGILADEVMEIIPKGSACYANMSDDSNSGAVFRKTVDASPMVLANNFSINDAQIIGGKFVPSSTVAPYDPAKFVQPIDTNDNLTNDDLFNKIHPFFNDSSDSQVADALNLVRGENNNADENYTPDSSVADALKLVRGQGNDSLENKLDTSSKLMTGNFENNYSSDVSAALNLVRNQNSNTSDSPKNYTNTTQETSTLDDDVVSALKFVRNQGSDSSAQNLDTLSKPMTGDFHGNYSSDVASALNLVRNQNSNISDLPKNYTNTTTQETFTLDDDVASALNYVRNQGSDSSAQNLDTLSKPMTGDFHGNYSPDVAAALKLVRGQRNDSSETKLDALPEPATDDYQNNYSPDVAAALKLVRGQDSNNNSTLYDGIKATLDVISPATKYIPESDYSFNDSNNQENVVLDPEVTAALKLVRGQGNDSLEQKLDNSLESATDNSQSNYSPDVAAALKLVRSGSDDNGSSDGNHSLDDSVQVALNQVRSNTSNNPPAAYSPLKNYDDSNAERFLEFCTHSKLAQKDWFFKDSLTLTRLHAFEQDYQNFVAGKHVNLNDVDIQCKYQELSKLHELYVEHGGNARDDLFNFSLTEDEFNDGVERNLRRITERSAKYLGRNYDTSRREGLRFNRHVLIPSINEFLVEHDDNYQKELRVNEENYNLLNSKLMNLAGRHAKSAKHNADFYYRMYENMDANIYCTDTSDVSFERAHYELSDFFNSSVITAPHIRNAISRISGDNGIIDTPEEYVAALEAIEDVTYAIHDNRKTIPHIIHDTVFHTPLMNLYLAGNLPGASNLIANLTNGGQLFEVLRGFRAARMFNKHNYNLPLVVKDVFFDTPKDAVDFVLKAPSNVRNIWQNGFDSSTAQVRAFDLGNDASYDVMAYLQVANALLNGTQYKNGSAVKTFGKVAGTALLGFNLKSTVDYGSRFGKVVKLMDTDWKSVWNIL